MLTTLSIQSIGIHTADSTVYVEPGAVAYEHTVHCGNSNKAIVDYQGGNIVFANMTTVVGTVNSYQYSALAFYNSAPSSQVYLDLTAIPGELATSRASVPFPDLEQGYPSQLKPCGLFLFHSPDGVSIELLSYSKVF